MISVRRASIDKSKNEILETRNKIKEFNGALQLLRRENELLLNMLPMAVSRVLGNRQSLLLTAAMKLLNIVPNKKNNGRKSWRKGFVSTHQKAGHDKNDCGSIEERNNLMTSQERSRLLIREIDRVTAYADDLVPSTILHTLPQLFPKKELLTDIKRELMMNILEDIRQEDSRNPYFQKVVTGENDDDSSCDTLDFEKDDATLPCRSNDIIEIDTTQDVDESSTGRSYQCFRNNIIDERHFEERRGTLTSKILSMRRRDSTDAEDDMQELLREAQDIDKTLKLSRIDKELYDAYDARAGYIIIRALHGYDTMMRTEQAIDALEKERDRLVAFFVSEELIDDALKW